VIESDNICPVANESETLHEWCGEENLLEKHRNKHEMNIGNEIFMIKAGNTAFSALTLLVGR